ncbi:MAG: AMP-binding protein [Erysipelotrichaceae bacterium]
MKAEERNAFSSIREMLEHAATVRAERIAFIDKVYGVEERHSYRQLYEDVVALGSALLDFGYADTHIGVVGENSYAWIVAYLAIITGVGVAVPLDKEYLAHTIGELSAKGDVEVLFISHAFEGEVDQLRMRNPKLKAIYTLRGDGGIVGLPELVRHGKALIANQDTRYFKRKVDPKALNVLMFTSGTTGANKGVQLSQDNLLANIEVASTLFRGYKHVVSVLPFHHIYENVCGILTPVNIGATVFINDSLKYLGENLKTYKPDMMTMVPLFVETMHKKLLHGIAQKHLEKTVAYSVKTSNGLRHIGIDVRRLWFKEIIKEYGGELRTIVCGGAFLRPDLIKAFREIGIEIINGYGITECAPLVSVNTAKHRDDESVGQVVSCCEVKISETNEEGDGEVLVRGRNVMLGYYKDLEATQASFEDGWFKTGDYGHLHNGSLYLTGRKKNLIVLSNGKNVHPEELETKIVQRMPYVKEVVVHSEKGHSGMDLIAASLYLDEELSTTIQNIEDTIEHDLAEVNELFPHYKQIERFHVVDHEFQKNASKKIMRYKFMEEVHRND